MFPRIGTLASLSLAATVFVLGGLAAPARASLITSAPQTAEIPLTQTNWGKANGGIPEALGFAKFNPSLGTLESVNLSYTYQFNHDVTLTFASPSTITETIASNGVSIDRPDNSLISKASLPDYTVSKTDSGPAFPHTVTLTPHVAPGTSPTTKLTSAADLALFTQTSSADTKIQLPVLATARSSFSTSSGMGGAGTQVYALVHATLTYTYQTNNSISAQVVPPADKTVVPEPSTFAVLALGVGGYLFARRNRRTH